MKIFRSNNKIIGAVATVMAITCALWLGYRIAQSAEGTNQWIQNDWSGVPGGTGDTDYAWRDENVTASAGGVSLSVPPPFSKIYPADGPWSGGRFDRTVVSGTYPDEAVKLDPSLYNVYLENLYNNEEIKGIAIDEEYMYLAGYDENTGVKHWRIEKRYLHDDEGGTYVAGDLVAGFSGNGIIANEGGTEAHAIAIDGMYMYIAGYDDNGQRIEKRSLSDGFHDIGFTGEPGEKGGGVAGSPVPGAVVNAIAIDGTYMYVAGYDPVGLRIEKRLLTTGALEKTYFGVSGVVVVPGITFRANAIAIDDTYMYVAGRDDLGLRIEKRLLHDGGLVTAFSAGDASDGVVTGEGGTVARAIAIDGTYMYAAGYDTEGLRIEKRFLESSAFDTDFDGAVGELGDGVVHSFVPGAAAHAIAIDSEYLYIAGYGIAGTARWRVEKRKLSNGRLVESFGAGGVMQDTTVSENKAHAIAIDSEHMYVAGYDDVGVDFQWRFEKRPLGFPPSGVYESATIDLAAPSMLGEISWTAVLPPQLEGDYDIVTGALSWTAKGWGIHYIHNDGSPGSPSWNYVGKEFGSYGTHFSPSFADMDNDGDYDMVLGRYAWHGAYKPHDVVYYKNTGSALEPQWTYMATIISVPYVDANARISTALADMDNDGDYDLVVSQHLVAVKYYRNDGCEGPDYIPQFTYVEDWPIVKGHITFGDIDADGDLDVVLKQRYTLYFHKNTGSPEAPSWGSYQTLYQTGTPWGAPYLADMDNDGDLDMILGSSYWLIYLPNTGTETNPQWLKTNESRIFYFYGDPLKAQCPQPAVVDIDNDVITFQIAAKAGFEPHGAGDWLDGDFLGPDGTHNTYFSVHKGQEIPSSIIGEDGKRYIRYRAYFYSTDSGYTPELNSVTLSYNDIKDMRGELVSRPFDSAFDGTRWTEIAWTENAADGNVGFQLRAASSEAGLSLATWLGPGDSTAAYYETTPSAEIITGAHRDDTEDRHVQYKVTLTADHPLRTANIGLQEIRLTYGVPSLILITPIGGEIMHYGVDTPVIEWDAPGFISSEVLSLFYSVDGGITYDTIAADVSATSGTYTWDLPDIKSDTVKVKITDSSVPPYTAESALVFSILPEIGNIRGIPESVITRSTVYISWTTSSVTQVKSVRLEYSTDNGVTYRVSPEILGTPIDGVIENTGSFTWVVPDNIALTNGEIRGRIRIADAEVPWGDVVFAESNAFAVRGNISDVGLGAAPVEAGSQVDINWNYTGFIPQFKLEYSTDNGSTWMDIAVWPPFVLLEYGTGQQTYFWTVPDTATSGETCVVRVSDLSDPSVRALSAPFKIIGRLAVTLPNGLEEWKAGTVREIQWTTPTGTIPYVKVSYLVIDEGEAAPFIVGVDSFFYRRPIVIYSSSTKALTDSPVLVTLDTEALVKAGKMQRTGADIRFTDLSGQELPYWIESGIGTAATKIWVKCNNIAPVGQTEIVMYYGNPYVKSRSDSAFGLLKVIDGLAGYWEMDEGSGGFIYDFSGNHYIGEVFGAAWVDGRSGGALSFDGVDDYVDLYEYDLIPVTGDWTISLWVKPDRPENSQYFFGAGGRTTLADNKYWGVLMRNDTMGVSLVNSAGGHHDKRVDYTPPLLHEWHHYVFIRRGDNFEAYVDGAYMGVASSSDRLRGKDDGYVQNTTIGMLRAIYDKSVNHYFADATCDEVAIFDQALSRYDVIDLYNGFPAAIFPGEMHIFYSEAASYLGALTVVVSTEEPASDGGSWQEYTIADSAGNTGALSWHVPAYLSGKVKVKVEDARDTDAFDVSDSHFSIVPPALTLDNIVGPLTAGGQYNIKWRYDSTVFDGFILYHSIDGGARYTVVEPGLGPDMTDDYVFSDGIYAFRMLITIMNVAGDPQRIELDTRSLIAAGKMQATGADIRFTDSFGEELSYYIESGINTGETIVWVKVDTVSRGSAPIYIYYGNPGANAPSYDDFTAGEVPAIPAAAGPEEAFPAADSLYTWTVPAVPSGADNKIKVEHIFYQDLMDRNDLHFGAGARSDTTISGRDSSAALELGRAADPDLVGLWHLDSIGGRQTIKDSSGQGHDGKVQEAAFNSTGQILGAGALSFDGVNDRADIPYSPDWNFAGRNITVAVWFKYTGGVDNYPMFLRHYIGAPRSGWYMGLGVNREKVRFAHLGATIPEDCTVQSAKAYNDSKWHFAVVTVDNLQDTITLYVDGGLAEGGETITAAGLSGLTDYDHELYIGGSGTQHRFSGSLDEIAIWNRVLTPDEVARLYNDGAGREAPLLYKLSGTFESRALDTGGNTGYGALSWKAVVPEGCLLAPEAAVRFQIAASDSEDGPWNFVGPDGTAVTYFTVSGQSVPAALDAKRYIKYKAYLETADPWHTPEVNEVRITFTNSAISGVSNSFVINYATGGSATVTLPGGNGAGSTGNFIIDIAPVNDIPADGRIIFTFPAGFSFAGPVGATSTAMDGGFTVTTSGQVVTIQRDGIGSPCPAGSVILSNIKNPTTLGVTGAYNLEVQTSGGGVMDMIDIPGSLIVIGATDAFVLSGQPAIGEPLPGDIFAGQRAAYMVTRRDAGGNLVTADVQTIYLHTISTGEFYDAATGGTLIDNSAGLLVIPDGQSSVNFWYEGHKAEAHTIYASDNPLGSDGDTGIDDASGAINVTHTLPDHLMFDPDVAVGNPVAGGTFSLSPLLAVDAYGNTVDGAGEGGSYSGSITVTYSLSGLANAPDWEIEGDPGQDSWTTGVDFVNGVSTTDLATILYRAQDTAVTAVATDTGTAPALPGTNTPSDIFTVASAPQDKLAFDAMDFDTPWTINVDLSPQPIVYIQDQYGNKTHDTDPVKLFYLKPAAAPVLISADVNPLAAVDGMAAFTGVKYGEMGQVQLMASVDALSGKDIYSAPIEFLAGATSTVEAAAAPMPNFDLIPTNDTPAAEFDVLRFKVKDAGEDGTPTLIDKIQIAIGGTGGNAANDIAWAGLYIDGSAAAIPAGSVTNGGIVFGSEPDSGSVAGLWGVADNASSEFTVKIYMHDGKLTAPDDETYIFDVDETLIFVDAGYSSRMMGDSGNVAPVIGTINAVCDHSEIVAADGTSPFEMIAGAAGNIEIRAVDANKNIDKDFKGWKPVAFTGLNPSVGQPPDAPEVNGGWSNVTLNFTDGVGGGALTAYKKETGSLEADLLDATTGVSLGYGAFPLPVNVSSAAADNISLVSGDNQSGAVNSPLGEPLKVVVKDAFLNPVVAGDTTVTFKTLGNLPGSMQSGVVATDVNGEAEDNLTLGGEVGANLAVAEASFSGFEGLPVEFTATVLSPAALNIIGGNNQSGEVALALTTPLTVQFVAADVNNTPIPSAAITFEVTSFPDGATGQAVASDSFVTDAEGKVYVTFTLGNKVGAYTVTASIDIAGAGTYVAEFFADATPAAPAKIVFDGPSSIGAGEVSEPFTITVRDGYENDSPVELDTVFGLSSDLASTTGEFFSDAEGLSEIIAVTLPKDASSVNFYYSDPTMFNRDVMVQRTSGQTGLDPSSAFKAVSIIPGDIDHFRIEASDTSAMTAGDLRSITIFARDSLNNTVTHFNGSMDVIFSGANPSPGPSIESPTCNGFGFGTDTTLGFVEGAATAELKLYLAESASIKAVSGGVATSDENALGLVVKHGAADHTKFDGDIPTPQDAGVKFSFDTDLLAVDAFDNVCDGVNGAGAYNETKDIVWTLSKEGNAPTSGEVDAFTGPVSFESGRSTTLLNATLYRAQDVTITAHIDGLTGIEADNVPSNTVTVLPGALSRFQFVLPLPGSPCVTTRPLDPQPKVGLTDVYGNPVTTVNPVTQLPYDVILEARDLQKETTGLNGTLRADNLRVSTGDTGVAVFSNVTYNYPEDIYLRAIIEGFSPENYLMTFKTGDEAVLAAGALAEPSGVSSLAYTYEKRAEALDFKITDGGVDGFDTKITKIVIGREADDTTGGWTDYIKEAYITDGEFQYPGVRVKDKLTFGDGTSTIYTVFDGGEKTYTLSIVLFPELPEGADGKVLDFSVTTENIGLAGLSSTFAAGAAALSNAPAIEVEATNFIITGDSTMNAGEGKNIIIRAIDINSNVDKNYTSIKSLVFRGAAESPSDPPYAPFCKVGASEFPFGSNTVINFDNGVSVLLEMTLYTAELAVIKASDNIAAIDTFNEHALTVLVSGGQASTLSWGVKPINMAVANSPWKAFTVNVTDASGNVASDSAIDVTISITGTGVSIGDGATETVAAENGIASFDNFFVYASAYPASVKIEASSSGITSTEPSDEIWIHEKYGITVIAKDYTSGAEFTDVSLKVYEKGVGAPIVEFLNDPSPFAFELPYGEYTLNFSKEKYVEENVKVVAGVEADGADRVYDNKITWRTDVMSILEATSDYRVMTSFVYDEDKDELAIRLWLERRGKLVTNENVNNKLGTAEIEVEDSEWAESWILGFDRPDPEDISAEAATYEETVFPLVGAGDTQWTAGKSYYARCTVGYGGLEGDVREYMGGTTFTITYSVALKAATEAIQAEVEGLQEEVVARADEMEAKQEEIIQAVKEELPAKLEEVKEEIVEKVKPHVISGILNRDVAVRIGDTVTIQYRTESGLGPLLDVYDPKNTLKISKQPMVAARMDSVTGASIYEYSVTFDPAWEAGDFTVVCSESSKGTVDAVIISVYRYDIEDVAGTVSAVLGVTAGLGDLEEVADSMSAQFGILEAALASISTEISTTVEEAIVGSTDLTSVHGNLTKISGQLEEISVLKEFSGLEGAFEVSTDKKDDIIYIRNKTQELKAMMELNQKMMDNVANEPIIQTWYEYGSVILKAVIINPSEVQEREVPFKVYLPKEAKPEHLLNRGNLNVAYDTQQGSYYVFATFRLKPKEVKEVEIEMKDIWKIDPSEIEMLRTEAKKVFDILKETEFSERGGFLLLGIEDKLDKILNSQAIIPPNPEVHISVYRENLKLLQEAKDDLSLARSLLSQVKPFPMRMTWKLIVAIVIFLGVLSAGFYVVWQKQMKLGATPTFEEEREEKSDKPTEEKSGEDSS